MGKHDKRPVKDDIGLAAQMPVVPMNEMTGALPVLLTPEQQAEVFDQVFGSEEEEYDRRRQ